MRRIGEHEQGSKEWKDARVGSIGASSIHRIMTAGTGALDTLREEYRRERALGEERQFRSRALDWGKKHEPAARATVELATGIDFEETGLVVHDELFYVGASPDGLNVEQRVGLELKCPYRQGNHLKHFEKIPKPYLWQMQAGLWVTGFERWLFASFDPRLRAEGQDLAMHWIDRNDRMIEQLAERIPWFWSTL